MAIIIPAIDMQGGEAVRLYKGDYAQKTVYGDPVELAKKFEAMGAEYLHLVDLDGAKSGGAENLATIKRVRAAVKMPIQLGGGIRSAGTVRLYLEEIKIDRVILGTAAAKNPQFLTDMLKAYTAERIVAGVDVRNGEVATSGWLEGSGIDYQEYLARIKQQGVKYIVATDISRDGTLTSPNWDLYDSITGLSVIVSGGVAENAHISRAGKYYGVIVGKAYYEGRVDLEECLKQQNV